MLTEAQHRALQQSRLRAEGRRHHRPVTKPGCARSGVLRGRIDCDSSVRSHRPGAAALAGAAPNDTVSSTTVTVRRRCTRRSTRKTGEVLGQTARRHNSKHAAACLRDIVAHPPANQKIHVISNYTVVAQEEPSAGLLRGHPTVQLQFAPARASWLNQVGLWLAKISRDVITRGVFGSVADPRTGSVHPGTARIPAW